ncbi:hypothetical protein ACVIGB_004296 [Bradyrhizobium sp. USDA 4341]
MQMSARPALRFPVQIDEERHLLVLSTNTDYFEFRGVPSQAFAGVIERIDGVSTVAEIAKGANVEEGTLARFLSVLREHDLAIEAEPAGYTGQELASLLADLYRDWNPSLFSRSLWSSLTWGTATQGVLDGWLIESYHFIRGANARLAYAAACTSDTRVRRIFAKHHSEEYDHFRFFADSLKRRNIDPLTVDKVGPLPSTMAVINMARRAARIDHLCYAACSGLLESTGSDAARARSFYDAVARHYDPDNTGFVEPMIQHVALDEGFNHGSVMRDVFEPIKEICSERANRIIATVSLFKETLELWFDEIERYYFLYGVFDIGAKRRSYRSEASQRPETKV